MDKVTSSFEGLFTYSNKSYHDERGNLTETFNKKVLEWLPKNTSFCHEITSFSKKNSLRGLHYQINNYPQGKLITCLSGKIFDVALDLRLGSDTYGKYFSVILYGASKDTIWIPRGFAHGYQCLEDSLIIYRCDNPYSAEDERCIAWNDEKISIEWPCPEIGMISEKDKCGLNFDESDKFGE